jgi:hypothetical protein
MGMAPGLSTGVAKEEWCGFVVLGVVAYHSVQVREPLHEGGRLGELLPEGIAEIMGWVCGDDQDALPDGCKLHGKAAGAGGFTDATLAPHEHPFQRFLLEQVAECRVQALVRHVHADHAAEHSNSYYMLCKETAR